MTKLIEKFIEIFAAVTIIMWLCYMATVVAALINDDFHPHYKDGVYTLEMDRHSELRIGQFIIC